MPVKHWLGIRHRHGEAVSWCHVGHVYTWLCSLYKGCNRFNDGCGRLHTLSPVLVCSKPVVGSLRLLGVAGARLDNPAMIVNHGFNDRDRHVSVDRVSRLVRILGVLHELLYPL